MLDARPFLKWVGGKNQLLPELLKVFPDRIGTYYEPFVGGGAVFFTLATQKRFQRAVINDWNQELINCYRAVRDFPADLIKQMSMLRYGKDVFDKLKAVDLARLSPIRQAARTIYLNKTGFNGLYRVNRKGVFNVPFGKYAKPPRIFDEANIIGCSEALNQFVAIHATDFGAVLDDATQGDLVYLDPPYVPVNPTSDFTSYTSKGFGIAEQERLARLFDLLSDRGVVVVASNSDTPLVHKLYDGHKIIPVKARRSINSKGDKRGPVGEVLIVANT